MSQITLSVVFPPLWTIALVTALIASQPVHAQEEQTYDGSGLTKKYIVRLETTQHKQYCKASISVEYIQNDDAASVSGQINNEDCAASSGEYTINVRIRDSEGQLVDLNFDETWQREDDQSIAFKRQYTIGQNVDLMRVRTRKLKCVCAEIQGKDEIQDKNQQ